MAQKSSLRAGRLGICCRLGLAPSFWFVSWPSAAQVSQTSSQQHPQRQIIKNPQEADPEERQEVLLTAERPIARDLSGARAHSYNIALNAGQFLRLVVDQRGIDVVVRIFGPNGKQLLEVDSPNGARGPEPVLFVAENSGQYRAEIRSLEAGAARGQYEARVEELRPATPDDSAGVKAQRLFSEGMRLYLAQGTAESKRAAVETFGEALGLWRPRESCQRSAHAGFHRPNPFLAGRSANGDRVCP